MEKSNYLFITEGKKTEPTIFEKILKKYGFNVISKREKVDCVDFENLVQTELSFDKANVVIVQGTHNRIHDLLRELDLKVSDISSIVNKNRHFFQAIFLFYDVDHNDCDDLEKIMCKFTDETEGMMLLSSPCIEVLAEYDDETECKYYHLKEYKSKLNKFYDNRNHCNTTEYIIDNFDELCLYFLKKNRDEFDENNIMEHPNLIVKKINELNERVNYPSISKEKSYVIYRYFTTVVYVAIAYINKLTKEIDNYEIVENFFLNNLKK